MSSAEPRHRPAKSSGHPRRRKGSAASGKASLKGKMAKEQVIDRTGVTNSLMNIKCKNESQRPMKIMRTVALVVLSSELLAMTGCVNPDGTVNNTATGAVIGGTVGALSGALLGGRHAGEAAFFGGVTGMIAGSLVGNAIDQQQRIYLQEQYPQTWQTIQHNDAVAQQQPPPPPPAPGPGDAPPPTPAASPGSSAPPAAAPQSGMVPLSLDDIKALTAAGVKPDVINKEIDLSQSKFNAQDIAAAQQANPPIDSAVIQDMKSHSS